MLRGGTRGWEGWSGVLRRAPLGVTVLGALLFLLGAGLVVGGVFLALSRREAGWVPWAAALLAGPAVIYMALHLLRLSRWAWLTMVLLVMLLLASSLVRVLAAPGELVAPLAEIAVELALLLYLGRAPVRRAFGR